jgi:DNA-binding MarR family transcriptional regulator
LPNSGAPPIDRGRPEPDGHVIRLTDLLMEYGHLMLHQRPADRARKVAGFGVIGVRAAIRLGLQGPMSMGDLAAALAVSPARMTQVVDVLEQAGLVERRRLETDRRVWRIGLKPDVDSRLEAEFARPLRALRHAWQGVPEGCRAAVLEFVERLVAGTRGEAPPGSE